MNLESVSMIDTALYGIRSAVRLFCATPLNSHCYFMYSLGSRNLKYYKDINAVTITDKV